jgi:hypothetical protein
MIRTDQNKIKSKQEQQHKRYLIRNLKKEPKMFSNMISHDEPSALAYQAYQMTTAGYEDAAEMILRKRYDFSPIFRKLSSAAARFFAGTRDLPAALAYDASQFADAGYLPEPSDDEKPTGLFENVTAWILTPAARRTATLHLAHKAS